VIGVGLVPRAGALALALLAVASSARAQSFSSERDPFADTLAPLTGAPEVEPLPALALHLVRAIPLPGPLPGGALRADGDRVLVPVAGGIVAADVAGRSAPELVAAPPGEPPGEAQWAVDADGRQRFAVRDGRLVAQRRCERCSRGWRRSWRVRIPGDRHALPLPHEQSVFAGGLDNRVYALRQRNGHRLWTADVGGRISRPLVLWQGSLPALEAGEGPLELDLVLVVPDHGARLLALEAETGRRVASIDLSDAEGSLVGVPLVTSDGHIVAARQRYAEGEADLLVWDLAPTDAANAAAERPRGSPATAPPLAARTPRGAAAQRPRRTTRISPLCTSQPSSAHSSTTSASPAVPAPS
jgi:hypothetical protein